MPLFLYLLLILLLCTVYDTNSLFHHVYSIGLIYRMVKPRIVLLIFVSGKVVLTGAKVRQEIYEAFDNIHPILKNFKKQ